MIFYLVLLINLSYAVYIDMPDYKDHPCIRDCKANSTMICEYNFNVESYYTLSKACFDCPFNHSDCQRPHCIAANGVSRPLLVVNRMLPGPALHVCENDTVIVNVNNNLQGSEGISIHWHGLRQKGTPYMDGVGMLTQCPIPAHTSFQYRFIAESIGTNYWHDHSGPQRSDGIFGPFIVRQALTQEVHSGLYDFDLPEHVLVIHDWLTELSVDRFTAHLHGVADKYPASLLINGKGTYQGLRKKSSGEWAFTPYETLYMEAGRRYRVRIISNGILHCPIQFSIDNHALTAIASDGHPFRPIKVDSINLFAGERYDVVLQTDQTVGNYWIRIKGLGDCSFKNASQLAILRYKGAPEETPSSSVATNGQRKNLNPLNHKASDSLIPVSELTSTDDLPDRALKEKSDKKFFLAIDFSKLNNYHFNYPSLYPISEMPHSSQTISPQINGITMTFPSSPPLTQFGDLAQDELCDEITVTKNCTEELCECLHLLKVDLYDTVELIVIDEGKYYDSNHPMHLHGYSFRVVGMDKKEICRKWCTVGAHGNSNGLLENTVTKDNEYVVYQKVMQCNDVVLSVFLASKITRQEVEELDRAGNITRNLVNPIRKDTVTIPDGGYTVLRLYADNPGFWFLHCHVELHVDVGMGLVFQVGELNQIAKIPDNFPKCGSWKLTDTPLLTP